MRPRTLQGLAGLGLLIGCGHTAPPTGADLDRWTGPWQPGPPIQLYPSPVTLLNFSSDGSGVLIGRVDPARAGSSPGARRPDFRERFVGLLPAAGGSGVWAYSDDRPGQRDSLNNVTAAAWRDGALLVQEETGPIRFDERSDTYPVLWHIELYLLDPLQPGKRRQLLRLFDEVNGQPVLPGGTLNRFLALQWAGPDRFVGEGGHLLVKPKEPIERLGLFVGTIGADTTTLVRIDDLAGVDRWSVTSDDQVLLQSGHDLALLSLDGGGRRALATIPGGPERVVMASRCDRVACWVISRNAPLATAGWEVWRIERPAGEPILVRTVAPSPRGTPLLPPAGEAVLVPFEGLLYRVDGVLAAP